MKQMTLQAAMIRVVFQREHNAISTSKRPPPPKQKKKKKKKDAFISILLISYNCSVQKKWLLF